MTYQTRFVEIEMKTNQHSDVIASFKILDSNLTNRILMKYNKMLYSTLNGNQQRNRLVTCC